MRLTIKKIKNSLMNNYFILNINTFLNEKFENFKYNWFLTIIIIYLEMNWFIIIANKKK